MTRAKVQQTRGWRVCRHTASRAPLAERSAVNRQVLGSIPSGGAYFLEFFILLQDKITFPCPAVVPVAQLDKASDYESEDWGFKSLQGYLLLFFWNVTK